MVFTDREFDKKKYFQIWKLQAFFSKRVTFTHSKNSGSALYVDKYSLKFHDIEPGIIF